VTGNPVFFYREKATFFELRSIAKQYLFEYLNRCLRTAAFTAQSYDGRTAQATDCHQCVKVSVERDHDSGAFQSEIQDVLILRPLHSELGNMPARIAQVAKERGRVRGDTLIEE
jgi:hypothetical protein